MKFPRFSPNLPDAEPNRLDTHAGITTHHIERCLAIISTLSGWLHREGGELDENVKNSLEASIINACNRLDEILTEKTLWALPEGDAHKEFYTRLRMQNAILAHELEALELRRQLTTAQLNRELPGTPPAPPTTTRRTRKKK